MSNDAIIALVLACTAGAVLAVVFVAIEFSCNPLTVWFDNELTNKEFDCLLDLIFNDPTTTCNDFHVKNSMYDCWVANGYYGLKINNAQNFTPFQKIKFFKRLKTWKRNNWRASGDKLHRDRIADAMFTDSVDSVLDDE